MFSNGRAKRKKTYMKLRQIVCLFINRTTLRFGSSVSESRERSHNDNFFQNENGWILGKSFEF